MLKRIALIACVWVFFFGTVGLSYSQEEEKNVTTQVTAQKVEVGNIICPVSSEKIDSATKVTYEYKGKIYNFCCPGCIDEFKKEPEKYIKKIDDENKAKDMQNGMSMTTAELAHQH